MKRPRIKARPPIVYGAVILAALSLAWSAYSITDLMDSGPYGLTVAIAGDIGWVTVLWAEAHSVTIAGRTWPAVAAGWLIAVGVGVLLAVHGGAADEHATAQAIAGPFVVGVGKLVWLFALAALHDPAALTPEQEAEIHSVMRDSEYEARLHGAEIERIERAADTEVARIKAEARTVLARDDVNFEVSLTRVRKRDEIARRTPLAITAAPAQPSFDRVAEQAIEVAQDIPSGRPDGEADTRMGMSGQTDAASGHEAPTSTDSRPDSPDPLSEIAKAASGPSDLVRSLAAHGVPKDALVSEAVRLRPDMVADSIRRTAKRLGEGPYL